MPTIPLPTIQIMLKAQHMHPMNVRALCGHTKMDIAAIIMHKSPRRKRQSVVVTSRDISIIVIYNSYRYPCLLLLFASTRCIIHPIDRAKVVMSSIMVIQQYRQPNIPLGLSGHTDMMNIVMPPAIMDARAKSISTKPRSIYYNCYLLYIIVYQYV